MKATLAISAVIFTLGFVSLPVVMSDGFSRWGEGDYDRHSTGVVMVNNPVYKDECGSCHMAYPAGLLPSSSWHKLMSQLEEHFGDNAELDPETHQSVTEFLLANSANRSGYRRSEHFNRSININMVPLRISETSYFRHEHDEIPERMVSGNPEVDSLGHCNACHVKAEQGSFNEHEIRIPGFDRWDD